LGRANKIIFYMSVSHVLCFMFYTSYSTGIGKISEGLNGGIRTRTIL